MQESTRLNEYAVPTQKLSSSLVTKVPSVTIRSQDDLKSCKLRDAIAIDHTPTTYLITGNTYSVSITSTRDAIKITHKRSGEITHTPMSNVIQYTYDD